jgi:hypothetical protein
MHFKKYTCTLLHKILTSYFYEIFTIPLQSKANDGMVLRDFLRRDNMTSPVNGNHNQGVAEIYTPTSHSQLPKQQKNIVISMYLASLALSITGVGLSLGCIGLFNTDLHDPRNMIISSLRFPCMVFGGSFLFCSEFVHRYFKKMHEMQREVSPALMHEINRQIEEKITANLTLNQCESSEQGD